MGRKLDIRMTNITEEFVTYTKMYIEALKYMHQQKIDTSNMSEQYNERKLEYIQQIKSYKK